jgi:hypothetical protein
MRGQGETFRLKRAFIQNECMESGVFMRRKRLAGVPQGVRVYAVGDVHDRADLVRQFCEIVRWGYLLLLREFMSCRSAASGDLTTLGPLVELPVSLRARFRPTRVPRPGAVAALLRSLPRAPDPY